MNYWKLKSTFTIPSKMKYLGIHLRKDVHRKLRKTLASGRDAAFMEDSASLKCQFCVWGGIDGLIAEGVRQREDRNSETLKKHRRGALVLPPSETYCRSAVKSAWPPER